MTAPYILARTFGEAHAFAQDELGVGRGHYRVVTSPSSVKGPRGADLYLVPGWEKRFDRFAMAGALKWTRLNKIDVAQWRAEQAEPVVEPDGLEPLGEQLSLADAGDFFDLPKDVDAPLDEPGGSHDDFDAPAEEPVKRRRRRCADCGLLVEPDEVESHAADHAADLVSLGRNPEGV